MLAEHLINNSYPLWMPIKSDFILENVLHVHSTDAAQFSHPSGVPERQTATTLKNKQILFVYRSFQKAKMHSPEISDLI